jgi:protein-S-isoprenylcysteine O-methyltransferase Ste14
VGLVRVPLVDLAVSSGPDRVTGFAPPRGVASRALVTYLPAVILVWLGVSQVGDVLRDWGPFTQEPNWTMACLLARSALYAAFVLGAATALVLSKAPRARDARQWVVVTSLTASFLLAATSFLPAGPVLWSASLRADEVGLLLSVIGATLALAAFVSLGSSFSITPEARTLVVKGPYRFLRHPIYLAELLMIVGVVVGYGRLTMLVGTLSVAGMQIYRIEAEERLLRESFPASFSDFSARTRFRLIPLVW